MATVNIGDVVEIVQTWDCPVASVAQNVWHLSMASGAGADSDDILDAVLTQQQIAFSEIETDINDGYEAVLLEARVWDFVNHRFDGVGSLAMTSMEGLASVDMVVHQYAALGRIVTESARRQGRTFMPGFTEDGLDNGLLLSATEARALLYLEIFDTDISVTGGVLNWCTFNVAPLSPVFETVSIATQTVVVNTIASTLGSRKVGVGL